MDCLAPVPLKSGIVVPCGKCAICRSNNRNEWSIRLAIHLQNCDRMPMFITLTYNDNYLPMMDYTGQGQMMRLSELKDDRELDKYYSPSLYRPDVSKFLKAYKRKYHLSNEDFQYFGCGEYGENYRRPHYHLLFFGDTDLYNDYFMDEEQARQRLTSVWRYGFVHIGVAGYDGIHYVTKYCLKEDLNFIDVNMVKPFTIASNGLGMNFLESNVGKKYKQRLDYVTRNLDEIFENCPYFEFNDVDSINDAIDYFERILPRFRVILDDGRSVFLPRAIRKKLLGSFEYFKDNPYWLYQSLLQVRDSIDYYKNFGDYDSNHDINYSMVALQNRVEKIQKRLLENRYNNKIKGL